MPINDPRDIPDLLVWLSPEAETAYTDGQTNIPELTDWSGNGYDFDSSGGITWEETTGRDGCPTYHFMNPGGASGGTLSLSGLSSAEFMMMVQAIEPPASSNGVPIWGGGQGSATHYTYSDDRVYEDWFSTTRRDFPLPTRNNWHRWGCWSATNDWAAQIDGVSQVTSGVNTPNGSSVRLGSNTLVHWWPGRMGAVVIYGRKLTAGERSDLAAWMEANPCGGIPFVPEPPAEPANVEAVPGCDSALMTWDAVEDATGYEVRLDGGSPVDVGTDLSYEFTGLSENTGYTGEVRAYNANGDSGWVSVLFTTDASPDAPSGLVASLVTSSQFTLCWDSVAEADDYQVTIDGGALTTVDGLCETFTGLVETTDYEVCVRACNDCGCSEYVCITVTTATPGPNVGVVACPCGNPVT